MSVTQSDFIADKQRRIREAIEGYNVAHQTLHRQTSQYSSNIMRSGSPAYIKRRMMIRLRTEYRLAVNKLIADRNAVVTEIQKETYHAQTLVGDTPENTRMMKAGLFCGINYTGTQYALHGCVSDAEKMAQFTQEHGWSAAPKMLTDMTSDKPTRDNIMQEFTNMLVQTKENEVSFFYYSGHGSYTPDQSGDEVTTMYDQIIFPIDFAHIVDDELKHVIQANMTSGATIIMLMDCCFSGTAMDLKYMYNDSLNGGTTTSNPRAAETPGDVIMISGCHDLQTSAEATISSIPQGAVTWAFTECMQTRGLTWHQLLVNMRDLLKQFGFTQIPQLTSGRKIDPQALISGWIQKA